MEELLKLLGLVAEDKKEEAQKLSDLVKSKINTLDVKFNEQEKLKIDAIASRDTVKTKLKDIALSFGTDVENMNDVIEAFKNKKTTTDDVKDKEILQLKSEVSTLATTLGNSKVEMNKELLAMSLKADISSALPKYNAKIAGYDFITSIIQKKAIYEDGKVVFKNEDGTSLRVDGADATTNDMVKNMFEKEKALNESMFFNIDVQASGAGAGAGTPTKGDFIP